MINSDNLDVERMKELQTLCNPSNASLTSSNFEKLCAVGLVFIRMWLDQEIKDKERMKGR